MGKISQISGKLVSRIPSCILKASVRAYDQFFCYPEAVLKQASQLIPAEVCLRFSVAIPHYNRGASIGRPLRNLLNHAAVEEIVIVDDGSHEDQWQSAREVVNQIAHHGKIRMHRRIKNLGALRTKLECVERCESPRVLLLDSDNTAFVNYLNAISNLTDSREDTIYCASWAFPFFPFHDFGNEAINFDRAAELSRTGLLKRRYIINDGNYLVPRDNYVNIISKIANAGNHAADVMLVNYRWLSAGNSIQILPSTSYLHRIEGGSFWENTKAISKVELMSIFKKLESREKWE